MANSISVETLKTANFDRSFAGVAQGIRTGTQKLNQADAVSTSKASKSFGEILSDVLKQGSKVEFSAHASKRLQSRGINLDKADYERLNAAYDKLAGKGARDSLVMLDDKAFLMSVKNKTVVTVLDKNDMLNNVFTNIDSAVIA
ncbi:MAG TPA: TIGR02530 family flagellar biosynthesis protein [Candidatus Wallbacteria bacterium]|nr:TIGR02530 family flagellar biosynthesis protein [Candidatus Wallbacteria bacterium]